MTYTCAYTLHSYSPIHIPTPTGHEHDHPLLREIMAKAKTS